MLTPEYLADAGGPMLRLFAQLEQDITADIARRVMKEKYLTPTAKWQVQKLREIGIFREKMADSLVRFGGMSKREARQLIMEACKKSLEYDDAIHTAAGFSPAPIAASKALMDVIEAGIIRTNRLMVNFTNTTGRTALNAFINALDRAYMQIMSGAFSFNTSLRQVVNDLAKKGITGVGFPSGGVEHLESAARRALITGLNQTTAQLQMARVQDMGTELVEVTSHAGARPTHAVWQGRIYSVNGRSGGHANFVDSTGYGTGDGLCGWNCYHSFYPYYDGLSSPSFTHDPAKKYLGRSNDEMYEESQEQRAHERAIRSSKRECATLDAAIQAAPNSELEASLKDDFKAASVKLKKREAEMRDFLKRTGRTREREREQPAGWNRSTSSKSVWAARR